MISKATINDFLAQRKLAVIGVSRQRHKFGHVLYRSLKAKGYQVFAINPHATTIAGDPCYPDVKALPEPVGGVVVVLPPAATEQMVPLLLNKASVESGCNKAASRLGPSPFAANTASAWCIRNAC